MTIIWVLVTFCVHPVFPQGCTPDPGTGLYVDATSKVSSPPYGCQTSPYLTLNQAIADIESSPGGSLILVPSDSPQVFGLSSFVCSQAITIQGNGQTVEIQDSIAINSGATFFLFNLSLQFNPNITTPPITLDGSLELEQVTVTGSNVQWGTMTGTLSFVSCLIKNTEKDLMMASQFGVQLFITDSVFFNNSASLLLFQPTVTSSNPTIFTLQSTRFLGGSAPSLAMYIDKAQFFGITIPGEEDNILTVTNCSWTDFSSVALKLSTWFISADFESCFFTANALGMVVDVGLSQLAITNTAFVSNLGLALSIPALGPIQVPYIIWLLGIQDCLFQDNGQGVFIGTGSVLANAFITNTVFQRNGTPGLDAGCISVSLISFYLTAVDFDGCIGNVGPAIYMSTAGWSVFSNIRVRNSHGFQGVGLYSVSQFRLILESSVFENLISDGSVFFTAVTNVTLWNTTFENCSAKNDLIKADLSVLSCDLLYVFNNFAGGQLISMSGSDQSFVVTNSVFANNLATYVYLHFGGNPVFFTSCFFTMIDPNTLLFINMAQLITLENCTLSGSFRSLFRGMLPSYIFNMTDCIVRDANVGWLLDGTYYNATLTNVVFSNVTIREGSSAPLFKISLYITNSSFIGVKGEMFYLSKSTVYLDSVEVSGYQTYLASTMVETWETNLVLMNVYIHSFIGRMVGSSLFQFNENSVVSCTNCILADLTQSDHSTGLISVSQSNLTLTNVFLDNWSVTMFTAKLSSIWIYNSTLTNGGNTQMNSSDFDGGLVNGLDVVTFWMENCFLASIGARNGGILYLTYDVPTQPMLQNVNEFNTFTVILNSNFEYSSATEDGGMFYVSEGSVSLYNSTFLNSSAGRNGGFFNFLCNPQVTDYNCTYNLTMVNLTHSSAGLDGGAIKYNRTQPILTMVNSADNSAVYGTFIAGYPVQLGFVNVSDLSFSQDFTLLSVNESSGQQMNTSVCLGLYDLNGKLVRTDNQSTMNIFLDPSINSSGLLSGQLGYIFNEGLCIVNKTITLTDLPGSLLILNFISDAIDYTHPDPNTGLTPLPTKLTYVLRNCTKGEIIKANTCIECPKLTYSFVIGAVFCKACLTGMDCNGGANAVVQSGYWSPCIESEDIYVCPQSSTCMGGNGTECATGYSSRLCSVCIDGWFAYGRGLCAQCACMGVEVMQGALIILGVMIYLLFIIRKSIMAAKNKQQSTLAAQLRILIHFVQIMMLMNHFSINWPATLSGYYDGLYTSGNSPLLAFSIECFYSQEGAAMRLVYVKLILISILPLFVIVVSCLIWSIVSAVKRSITYLTQHNICSICVLLTTLHPLILLRAFKLLTCIPMETDTSWLAADTTIQCWAGEQAKYTVIMVIPVLIVWCVGIPLTLYLYFLTNRKRLKEEAVMRRLAFLYSGYNEDSCYWEFVEIGKKSFFVMVANLLSASNGNVQTHTGLVVLLFFLLLHIAKQPYKNVNLNRLVTHSLIAPVVTLMCGLVTNTYLGTTASLYYLMLLLIYSVNANYVLRSGSGLIISGREWLAQKFPILRKCLCLKRKRDYVSPERPPNTLSAPQRSGLG